MTRFLVATALAAAGLGIAACGTSAAPGHPKLERVRSFAFALGSGNLDARIPMRPFLCR